MSRPRKPYGPNPPGRLPATMIKVLAAELSDPNRLSRGKRYWADDAVIDLVIGHGAVTAEVQGSRSEPYIVTLEAAHGDGVPTKREIWVRCTCPDDAGDGAAACKHAVAVLFAVSDEVAIDPEVIDRWRTGTRAARESSATATAIVTPIGDRGDDDDDDDDDDGRSDGSSGAIAEVIELHRRREPEPGSEPEPEPDVAEIALLLRPPAGAALPELPAPEPIQHPPMRDRVVADVLADALAHLEVRWE